MKKYEIEAQHDFGNTPKDGLLKIYERHLDDEELLVSIIRDLLKFPAPLTIRIDKMRVCSESETK